MKIRLLKSLGVRSATIALALGLSSCAEVSDPLIIAASVPANAVFLAGMVGVGTIAGVLSIFDAEERERELKPREDGAFTDYWPNGKKRAEGSYKNKKLNGLYRTYYRNGEKKSEVTYEAGQRNGPHTSWHENGQKSVEGVFQDGRQHGPIRSYHDNGQISFIKSGSLNGTNTAWHENGQKQSVSIYREGRLVSRKVWNKEGQKIETDG